MPLKTYRLSDLLTLKYGKNQSNVESKEGLYPIYGTGGIIGQATEYLYDKPSILIGRKGSIEKVRYVDKPFWSVDTTFYSIINDKIVDPYFLFCLLTRVDLSQFDEGTSIPSLRTETLYKMELKLPDIETQITIASFIKLLDQYRQLLESINDNLFKILESEYNIIADEYPKEIELSSLCHIIKDKRSSNGLTINNYYSTENILPNKAGVVSATSLPLDGKVTHCIEGDVLISNIRPYFKKIHYCDRISGCSADVLCFRSKEEGYSPYLYSILRSDDFFDYVVAGSKGTKMPRGDKEHIIQYMIPNPPKDVLNSFNTTAKSILSIISNNCKINLQLVCMRDYLIPKLMSGEIDVSTIELPTKYSFICLRQSI